MQRKTIDPRQRSGKVAASAGELLKDPERLLDDRELAVVLRRSRSRIQKDRLDGRGPPYVKNGRLIRYRAGDVRDHLRALTIRPNAPQGQGAAIAAEAR